MTAVRFVLLLSAPTEDDVSAPGVGRRAGLLVRWVDDLRRDGMFVDGGAVEAGAVAVRSAGGGLSTVAVPADAIARVRSWLLIDAADTEAALAVARACPEAAHGDVPVLPVDER